MELKALHILLFAFFAFAATMVNAQDTFETQSDIERVNQLLKELLPDEKFAVNESGIRESEYFSLVIDFVLNRQLERDVITIDEKNLTFDLCCMPATEENPDGTTTDHLTSVTYPLKPAQLPLVKELKTLIDNIQKAEK